MKKPSIVLLVGLIAVLVSVHMHGGRSYSSPIDKPEFSFVPLFETIVIDNASLNPETDFAILKAIQRVIGIGREYSISAMEFLSRPESEAKIIPGFWMGVLCGEWISLAEGFAHNPGIKSGGLAGIFQNCRKDETTVDSLDLSRTRADSG